MKRELKKAIARIRKAQDAVINKKIDGVRTLGLDAHHYIYPDIDSTYFSITIHKDIRDCKIFNLGMFDDEDVNEVLKQISDYINYDI